MTAAEIVAKLGGQWRGSYGLVPCPAHKDRIPSLSITDGKTGGRSSTASPAASRWP